jgi:hypothetical protein
MDDVCSKTKAKNFKPDHRLMSIFILPESPSVEEVIQITLFCPCALLRAGHVLLLMLLTTRFYRYAGFQISCIPGAVYSAAFG